MAECGLLYEYGANSDGDGKLCDKVIGKGFTTLRPYHSSEFVGSTDDSTFLISTGHVIVSNNFTQISSSKTVTCGISSDGLVYSWGSGTRGELGLGAVYQQIEQPTSLKLEGTFISLSSGSNHSVVCDSKGNCYGWGENNERQLGLYTKPKVQLESQGGKVEDVSLLPRFIPFSLKNPVQQVACGSNYTLFLTKVGKVWSCGSGESGQLGTGSLSRIEIPTRVYLDEEDTIIIQFICTGYAHNLALTRTNKLYTWGLNTHGQLGLNHTKTIATPNRIETLPKSLTIASIQAHNNSSACISQKGLLYTWGNNRYNRLLHGSSTSSVFKPQRVEKLINNKVTQFVFGMTSSLVQIASELLEVYPTCTTCSQVIDLSLFGSALWDTGNVQVAFMYTIPPDSNPASHPHSISYDKDQINNQVDISNVQPLNTNANTIICKGKLQYGKIICQTPLFPYSGLYQIQLSLDGNVYLPQLLSLYVYPDMKLLSPSISIVNRRYTRQHTYHIPVVLDKVSNDDVIKQLLSHELSIKLKSTTLMNSFASRYTEAVVHGRIRPITNKIYNGEYSGNTEYQAEFTIDFYHERNHLFYNDEPFYLYPSLSVNDKDYLHSDLVYTESSYLLCHSMDMIQVQPEVILQLYSKPSDLATDTATSATIEPGQAINNDMVTNNDSLINEQDGENTSTEVQEIKYNPNRMTVCLHGNLRPSHLPHHHFTLQARYTTVFPEYLSHNLEIIREVSVEDIKDDTMKLISPTMSDFKDILFEQLKSTISTDTSHQDTDSSITVNTTQPVEGVVIEATQQSEDAESVDILVNDLLSMPTYLQINLHLYAVVPKEPVTCTSASSGNTDITVNQSRNVCQSLDIIETNGNDVNHIVEVHNTDDTTPIDSIINDNYQQILLSKQHISYTLYQPHILTATPALVRANTTIDIRIESLSIVPTYRDIAILSPQGMIIGQSTWMTVSEYEQFKNNNNNNNNNMDNSMLPKLNDDVMDVEIVSSSALNQNDIILSEKDDEDIINISKEGKDDSAVSKINSADIAYMAEISQKLLNIAMENITTYPIICTLSPNMWNNNDSDNSIPTNDQNKSLDYIYLSPLLDGNTVWPVDLCPKITFFPDLTLSTLSKTKPGTVATAVVTGYTLPTDTTTYACTLRLCNEIFPSILPSSNIENNSGSTTSRTPVETAREIVKKHTGVETAPSHYLDIKAELSPNMDKTNHIIPMSTKVTFTVPTIDQCTAAGILVISENKNKGKEKDKKKVGGSGSSSSGLYIGISIDNNRSFDYTQEPILEIK